MGGETIALFAAQYPDFPRFLILEDPAWWETSAKISPKKAGQALQKFTAEMTDWRNAVQATQKATWEEGLQQIKLRHPNWSHLDQELSLVGDLQVDISCFDFFPEPVAPWRTGVSHIQCPTLLLLGDSAESGAIVSPQMAAEAGALASNLKWVQIPKAGHSIRYDQFEQTLAVVNTFLANIT
jgi:N-formylmaleamate deformylase